MPQDLRRHGLSALSTSLKSTGFCSRSQSEYSHFFDVLPINDEFRERIVFRGTHEKFRKGLAQCICNDELRRRDAGANGTQPGAERFPNELGSDDGEILEQSLGDNAGLDEGMIGVYRGYARRAVRKRRSGPRVPASQQPARNGP